MICPVCSEVMLILEYKEIEIDYCTSCQGIWLDEGEMEAITGFEKKIDLSDFPKTQKSKRNCPRCLTKMVKGPFPGTAIEVDVCRRDGGIWLDKGEIQSIAGDLCSPGNHNEICQFFSELFDDTSEIKEK
jgi:Zn-finger nucleic acid-binding protein